MPTDLSLIDLGTLIMYALYEYSQLGHRHAQNCH